MCNNHPKFDEDLLPPNLGVQFLYYNQDAARKIIIAEVVDIGAPIPYPVISCGHAICNPTDRYDHARGQAIATGRAVKAWWKDDQRKAALLNLRRELPAFVSARV